MTTTTFLLTLFAATAFAYPKGIGSSPPQDTSSSDALTNKHDSNHGNHDIAIDPLSPSNPYISYRPFFDTARTMSKCYSAYRLTCPSYLELIIYTASRLAQMPHSVDITHPDSTGYLHTIIDTMAHLKDATIETYDEALVQRLVDTVIDAYGRMTAVYDAHIAAFKKSLGIDGDDVVLKDLFYKPKTSEADGKITSDEMYDTVDDAIVYLRAMHGFESDELRAVIHTAFADVDDGKSVGMVDVATVLRDKVRQLDRLRDSSGGGEARVLEGQEL